MEKTEVPETTNAPETTTAPETEPTAKEPSQGLKFALNDDGQSFRVIGIGTCTDTDLIIPSTYIGLPVTSIGERAFLGCAGLTSVTIPDSVTSIGWNAFGDCTSLADIYCEVPSKPSDWNSSWLLDCPATVHWGWKGE